jgi:hypothetical protein
MLLPAEDAWPERRHWTKRLIVSTYGAEMDAHRVREKNAAASSSDAAQRKKAHDVYSASEENRSIHPNHGRRGREAAPRLRLRRD